MDYLPDLKVRRFKKKKCFPTRNSEREGKKDEEYEPSQLTQEEGTLTVESVEKEPIVSRLVPQPSVAVSENIPVDVTEGRSAIDNAEYVSGANSVPKETEHVPSAGRSKERPGIGIDSEPESDDMFNEDIVPKSTPRTRRHKRRRSERNKRYAQKQRVSRKTQPSWRRSAL